MDLRNVIGAEPRYTVPEHRVVHKNGNLTDNVVTNLEWRVPE